MNSLWNDQEAARFEGPLGQRVYTSRLLGQDSSLVLHGGGNTSVKLRQENLFGESEEILFIKGRGTNLATIDANGFSPCRLAHLQRLCDLKELSDEHMENELKLSMSRASAPAPSVETLVHALLPAKFVDHTHAGALISVMNSHNGIERVQELYGEQVVIVPYAMPGFRLVRVCREIFPSLVTGTSIGVVLAHHGVFTFGDTAKASYERMIELVDRAERYLDSQGAWLLDWADPPKGRVTLHEISKLRRAVCDVTGAPMIVATHSDPQVLGFAQRSDILDLAQRGGITPDHVIRTKRVPMVGRDVAAYSAAYREYVQRHANGRALAAVDSAPRVILDPEIGLGVVGRSAEDAVVAEDIYRHTIEVILRSEKLGGWRALPSQDFFDVEYWDMERAKLAKRGPDPVLMGEVALVTGAASGIGKACVESFLARGAAVVGLDLASAVTQLHDQKSYLGLE